MRCPVCQSDLSGTPKRCGRCYRPQPQSDSASNVVLETHNVTKRYGSGHTEVVAVNQINLRAARGEIVLIMGPSGSGKTSLLLLLGCLMQPSDGQITFLSTEVTRLPSNKLPEFRLLHLGFVFQNFNLLASLTAQENVAVPMHLAGIRPAIIRERASVLLQELGLGHRLGNRPAQLSGGEKQRVAIARALALGPELILADEPTANLDSKSGTIVMEHFRRIAKAEQCSLIIVSHDQRLREISDRILWLEDGKVREITPTNGTGPASETTHQPAPLSS